MVQDKIPKGFMVMWTVQDLYFFLLKIKSIEVKLYTNILNFLISLKEFLLEKLKIENLKVKCFLKVFNCQKRENKSRTV